MQRVRNIKKFVEFEKEENLFLRTYNGTPYWRVIRFEMDAHIFSTAYETWCSISKTDTYRKKFARQWKYLRHGLKSAVAFRKVEPCDFIYFKADAGHNKFYDCWDSKTGFRTMTLSYEPLEGAIDQGIQIFWSAVKYHVLKALHLIKRDEKEYQFLCELEKKMIKEFGYSLTADAMETIIQRYAVENQILGRYFEKLFDRIKPKVFVVVCYYTNQLYPAYRAARKRGIKIVEFQHGTIRNHTSYWFEDQRGINNETPDFLLTFGELWSSWIKMLDCTRAVPVGFPFQENELKKLEDVKQDEKKIIIYPYADTKFEKLMCSFAKKATEEGYDVYAKIHPGESKEVSIYYPQMTTCPDIKIITDQSKGIYYWLKLAKHHILTNTTVALEAVTVDGNNIYVATGFPHESSRILLDLGLARGFRTAEELLKAVKEPVDSSMDELRQQLWKKDSANNVRAFFDALLENG